MKKIIYMLAAGLLALTACNKEILPHEDASDNGDLQRVTLKFATAEPVTLSTKANGLSHSADNFIDRLDIYVFKNGSSTCSEHIVKTDASGIDLSTVSYTDYDVKGTSFVFMVLANLDAATADYLAGLTTSQLVSYDGGLIILSEGNFRLHKPIMGGSSYCSLGRNNYSSSDTGDRTLTITLHRYCARMEIEKITANFDDASYMNKDVIVKRIAWINQPTALRPFMKWPEGYVQDYPCVVFGSRSTYNREAEFGRLEYEDGYHYYETNCIYHGWTNIQTDKIDLSAYGATGSLAAEFPYQLNNNFELERGVLNVDATGDRLTATTHSFSGDEGRICSSTNLSQSHVLNVNKEFYVVPMYTNGYSTYMCTEFQGQDNTMKLVIEVEIDGQTYFYPIRALYIQPESVYKIHNITIKGIGSPYSNFYLKKYEGSLSAVSVGDWTDLEVDNIDLGYSDYGGTNIY